MPPKRLLKAKDQHSAKKARSAAKEINEVELTQELNEMMLTRLSSEREQSPTSEGCSPSSSGRDFPLLGAKKRRIQSRVRSLFGSPQSSRDSSSRDGSPVGRSPSPSSSRTDSPEISASKTPSVPQGPPAKISNRALRYEMRLNSVSEKERDKTPRKSAPKAVVPVPSRSGQGSGGPGAKTSSTKNDRRIQPAHKGHSNRCNTTSDDHPLKHASGKDGPDPMRVIQKAPKSVKNDHNRKSHGNSASGHGKPEKVVQSAQEMPQLDVTDPGLGTSGQGKSDGHALKQKGQVGKVQRDGKRSEQNGPVSSSQDSRKLKGQSSTSKVQKEEKGGKPAGCTSSSKPTHYRAQPNQSASGHNKQGHMKAVQSATAQAKHDDQTRNFHSHDTIGQVNIASQDSRRIIPSTSGHGDQAREQNGQGSSSQHNEEEEGEDEPFHYEPEQVEPEVNTSTSTDNTASRLANENRRLKEIVKRLERKLNTMEKEKLEAVNHALKLSIELQDLREGNNETPTLEFTEVDDVPVSTEDMERLSARSNTDSMFVGLLLTAIIGSERLVKMSTTGQPSRRYAKMTNSDGTLVYPATEAVDPYIIDFLCDKVAERNQMLVGYRNISKIRQASTDYKIKGYITTKIGNLKKADVNRKHGVDHVQSSSD